MMKAVYRLWRVSSVSAGGFEMKPKLLALALLAGSSMFGAVRVGVGIELGAPPPPPRTHFVRPVAPSRDHVWINGYYEPVGREYRWREGYWAPRPFSHAVWVAPRYHRHRYYPGYWKR